MKKVTKHLLIMAILTLISTNTLAQEGQLTDMQKAQMETQLDEYYAKLDLSETQQPKFEEITIRYGKQMMALKESGKGRLAKYKEFKSIRNHKNEEMKTILTKEQYGAYELIQKEMQEKMKENNSGKN